MRTKATIIGIGLALTLFLAALPAPAGEGRIPVWQPIQILPGGEGKYVVTRNITANPGAPVIDVQPGTGPVEIDLNGFTLYGADVHVIQAQAIDSLTVRNGTILSGAQDGIHVEEARKIVVEDVKIQQLEGRGIALLEVSNFALRRNVVHALTQGEAIYVDGAFADQTVPTEGSIESNLLRECYRGITLYFGSSVGIRNNRIEASGADGIFVAPGPNDPSWGCLACLILENTIQESGANGMWLSHFEASKVYNNTVTFSGAEGIFVDVLSDDNLVLDNVSSQNGANGLLVTSNNNHLERNVLNSNGTLVAPSWGMYLQGNNNTYRGNTAQANPGGAACTGFGTTDFCDTGAGNVSPFNQPPALVGDNLMPTLL